MTVEELEKILHNVSNKKIKVCFASGIYDTSDIKGYYNKIINKEELFMLTSLSVQPFSAPSDIEV